jgi:Carboxypeptidase regulatory-like domain
MSLRLFISVLVYASFASAQTTTGTIQGQVRDATGAGVPAAKVVVTNSRTGVTNELHTNAEGFYVVPFLLPGDYNVDVEKEGFQRFTQNDIKLDVQQNRAIDVTLAVGDVTTTVSVEGAPPPIATTTSSLATVIENKRISDMPLNGRNPYQLALLTPGVIGTLGTDIPWIGGGRNASSEISIDGTSVILPENNVSINTLAYTPSVDAVQEFSVITNNLSAEYGRTGGGVINVATKQGTNTIHGTAFDFLRNSELDANGFFKNRNRTPRAAFQQNQFGGTIGGPVFIPNLYDGRNRTFFFFDEQSKRARSASTLTTTVPLDAWRQGDFSNLRNTAGAPILIYDPVTTRSDGAGNFIRDPFPGNVIPADRIDPVARNLMKFFPEPNANPSNQFSQVNNYFGSSKSVNDDDRFDVRIDQNFSAKWRMFGRVSYSVSQTQPHNFFGNAGTPSGNGPSGSDNYSASLDQTFTLNPTTIVNLRYGFGRFDNVSAPFSKGFDLTSLGFPAAVKNEASNYDLEFPRIDTTGLGSLGQATFTSLKFVPNSHIAHADITKVLSRHTLKAGVEFRKMLLNFRQLGSPSGSYSFNTSWTQRDPVQASSTAGSGLASLLLGLPGSGSISHDPTTAMSSTYWGAYLQDDFRVSNNLTLNLGVRYDLDIPRTERFNQLSYFDINAPSPIAGQVPQFPNLVGAIKFVNGSNPHQTPTDANNIGPHFGFAYKLGSKMVARGGYALMYSGSVMQAAGASGSAGTEGFSSSTNMIVSLDGRVPLNYLRNPYPSGFNLPLGATPGPTSGPYTDLGLGIGADFFNDYRNPVIQQWNFNLQRELPGQMVVELGYLANKGNHLIDGEGNMTYNQLPASYFALGNSLNDQVPNPFYGVILNPNSILSKPTVVRSQLLRPYPQYTSVNAFRKPQANSIYHAFTTRVEKRYSHGLALLGSYTFGKLIDDASQTVTFLGPAGNKQDFYNRHGERSVSTQDVSSRLVMSFVYDLPFGRGHKLLGGIPRAVNAAVGGWQVNGIATFQTGTPIILTQTQNNTGIGSSGQRPNNNGTSAKITGGTKDQRVNQWFNTSVFSFAPPFTFGNVPRTLPDVRNPGVRNLDLSLFKNFRFKEGRINTQFRIEAFNATNTTLFAAPGAVVGDPALGVVSGQNPNVNPRQVQIALKVIW